jgi:hypothetical protein
MIKRLIKLIGFIPKWMYKKGTSPNNGAVLFNFNWRNPDKISNDIKKTTKYNKSNKK